MKYLAPANIKFAKYPFAHAQFNKWRIRKNVFNKKIVELANISSNYRGYFPNVANFVELQSNERNERTPSCSKRRPQLNAFFVEGGLMTGFGLVPYALPRMRKKCHNHKRLCFDVILQSIYCVFQKFVCQTCANYTFLGSFRAICLCKFYITNIS